MNFLIKNALLGLFVFCTTMTTMGMDSSGSFDELLTQNSQNCAEDKRKLFLNYLGEFNYKAAEEVLKENPCFVNHTNQAGDTLLLKAIASKNSETTELFLKYGANPNTKNLRGETALGILVCSSKNLKPNDVGISSGTLQRELMDLLAEHCSEEEVTTWCGIAQVIQRNMRHQAVRDIIQISTIDPLLVVGQLHQDLSLQNINTKKRKQSTVLTTESAPKKRKRINHMYVPCEENVISAMQEVDTKNIVSGKRTHKPIKTITY
jgi:hypothetical protein